MADWDVSMMTSMRGSCSRQVAVRRRDISRWDTSAVTDMYRMFRDAGAFNEDIGAWDTSSVTTMEQMFLPSRRVQSAFIEIGRQPGHNHEVHVLIDADAFNKDILAVTHPESGTSSPSLYILLCRRMGCEVQGGGSSTLPDRRTRRDDACDASFRPVNGDVLTSAPTPSRAARPASPECNAGPVPQGVTTCTNRVLTETRWLPDVTTRSDALGCS